MLRCMHLNLEKYTQYIAICIGCIFSSFKIYTVYAVHLAVVLIWWFGGFGFDRQIEIIANAVVLSQILINSNDERAYLPN